MSIDGLPTLNGRPTSLIHISIICEKICLTDIVHVSNENVLIIQTEIVKATIAGFRMHYVLSVGYYVSGFASLSMLKCVTSNIYGKIQYFENSFNTCIMLAE